MSDATPAPPASPVRLPGSSRTSQWLERAAVAALALGHIALGLVIFPQWMFGKYPDAARLLVAGTLRAEEGGDFSPLYLLINALVGPTPLRWLQSIAGGACLGAVYWIARTLFGRGSGLIAAGLFGLAAPLILYEATLEPDVTVMVLNTFAVALLLGGAPSRSTAADVAAGVALGLSIAARPTAGVFLVLALAWSFFRQRAASAPRPWQRPAVIAALALLMSLLPPLALRAMVGQSLGATMSAGAVLQLGNRPEGTGRGAHPPLLIKLLELQIRSPQNPDPVHGLYRRFARSSAGEELSPGQTGRFWIGKSLAFVVAEPAAYLALLGLKLRFFVFGPDGHDITEVRLAAVRLSRLPLVQTGWLGLLGTAALALLLAGRQRIGLIALYIAGTTCLALGFYVVSRFRLATVPEWCVLIGGLIGVARQSLGAPKQIAVGVLALASAVIGAWLSSSVRDAQRMQQRVGAALELAHAMDRERQAGRLDEATRFFIQAQAAQPFVWVTHDLRGIPFESEAVNSASLRVSLERFGDRDPTDAFFAGLLAARAGQCAAALPALKRASDTGFRSAIFDLSLDPDLVLAECSLKGGDREGAVQWIARSLAKTPGTLDGLAMAVAGGAGVQSERELFALHDALSAHYALAKARLAFADAAGALADADTVLAQLPEAAIVHYERARALAMLDRLPEAADAYDRALQLFPEFVFAGKPFDAAIEARLRDSPDDPQVLSLAAEHRLRRGDIAAAREFANRASQLWGDRAPRSHLARQRLLNQVR